MPVSTGESIFATLEPHLTGVSKPIQYVGGELNSTVKDWDATDVRWALMYPDAYEVGLPNQGVMILYELLNEQPGVLAERTYAVWPDLGTVLVLVFLILVVLAVSGVATRWLAGLVLVGGLLVFGAVHAGALSKYQVDRITAFTHPNDDSRSTGWNTAQARIAIGSGGVLGKGLFNGPQTNGQFVPEQQTDFVYTVAGEEFGLVGAGGIIALFGVVLWRGLRIASRATDAFGTLVAVGVVAWFTFQGFENIGMTLGIMPVTGLPLPFVSYGGSSMFANMMAIGLLQNVHLRTSAG